MRPAGSPAVFTNLLHLWARSRQLRAQGWIDKTASLIAETLLPPLERCRAARFFRSPQAPLSARAARRRKVGQQIGHAAALNDGHVRQHADRLASTRARRAAAARDVRSAGTASPVPKYISSGVWPRNAECGSTQLCSRT